MKNIEDNLLLSRITPIILTHNEAANISRVLGQLTWAQHVVVVDSGSQDGTQSIVNGYPNTRLYEREFDCHAIQWNFALEETGIRSEWILALDADHVLTRELRRELVTLTPAEDESGFRVAFTYCVLGQPLRASLYPPLVSLFRRGRARYVQQGHTQRLVIEGTIRSLKGHILHDDRKSFSHWVRSQNEYMRLEARLIKESTWGDLSWPNRLRKFIVPAPFAALIWSLLVKRTLLDGIPGVYYSMQRMLAESILSFHLLAGIRR
ncbi:MAG: glycosyltransferase family 2 protein [Rhodothermia bacterium]|nr:MAG: glycosyltransferase family 2 protein [Rhodothermia bacterium]